MTTDNQKKYSWDELAKLKEGTIVRDWMEDGVRCLIMRATSSLTAYVGVPLIHPLAGMDYDDLPLSCHYGLTFGSEGNGTHPKEWYWYGWDYAHSGDYCFYYDDPRFPSLHKHKHENKKWTVDEVESEVRSVLYDFKRLIRLSEKISKNAIANTTIES